jgi:hypothetical protein
LPHRWRKLWPKAVWSADLGETNAELAREAA